MARDFNGTTDVVYIDTQSQAYTGDFTMCLWAYPDTSGENGNGSFFALRQSTTVRVELFSIATNLPRCQIGFGTSVNIDGVNNDITLGAWQHFAVRYRSSDDQKDLIKNAAILASNTTDTGTGTISASMAVGSMDNIGSTAFDGRLCDFHWYDVFLSLDEIAMLMRGMVVRTDKAKLNWPTFGVQSPEPDWSGNGRHGTVSGTVTIDHPPGISAVWLGPNPKRVQRVFSVTTPITPPTGEMALAGLGGVMDLGIKVETSRKGT